MKVLQHTRNKRNVFFKPDRADRNNRDRLLRSCRSRANVANMNEPKQTAITMHMTNLIEVSKFTNGKPVQTYHSKTSTHLQRSSFAALLMTSYILVMQRFRVVYTMEYPRVWDVC